MTVSYISSTSSSVTLSGSNVVVAAGTEAGTYILTYQICENLNSSNCDQAEVTVTVTAPVIDAVADAGSANGMSGGTAVTNVLSNDLLNGAAVVPSKVNLSVVSSSNSGVTLSGTNIIVAAGTPSGTYTLTYQICEILNPSNCEQADVTVTVTAPPVVAVADIGKPVSGYNGGIAVSNVLVNDLLNGSAVSLSQVNLTQVNSANAGVSLDPATGAVTVAAGTPAGIYIIVYQVCEKLHPANCDQNTVEVTVIDYKPVALNDTNITNEDTPVSNYVSANDTPSLDGGNIWSLTGTNGGATHGTVTLSTEGYYTYIPDPNYNGTDVFNYRLCDVNNDCSNATVTISIIAVPDPPIAINDDFLAKENQKLEGNISGNDIDVDGLVLTVITTPVQAASHGTLVLNSDGTFTYQPIIDFMGTDSFVYQICDNRTPALCTTATVTIVVSKDENCIVFIPNSFSPNGDGIHDLFKIRCLYNYENPVIEIYNRWGNLVFKKDHYGDVDFWGSETDSWWNGYSDHKWTIGNEKLPVGTYYYILKLNRPKVLTGFLFLNY